MTAPRYILPDSCYLITRRTTQRMFMLPPDEHTKRIFEFCLALAAMRFGMSILGWLVMSNHYHLVVHDQKGVVPAFVQLLNRLLASTCNDRWKRLENFWSSEPACITRLATEDDVIEKIAYTLANPVTAKLVDSVEEWPGSSSLPYFDGKTRVVKRPDFYFSKTRNEIPAELSLRIVQPPTSAKRESLAAWVKRIEERIPEVIKRTAAMRERDPKRTAAMREEDAKRTTTGVKAVLARPHTHRPAKKDVARKLRPHLACRERKARIAELVRMKQFRIHYDDAMKELEEGNAHAVFPRGTYVRPRGRRRVIGKRPPAPVETVMKHITRIPVDDMGDSVGA